MKNKILCLIITLLLFLNIESDGNLLTPQKINIRTIKIHKDTTVTENSVIYHTDTTKNKKIYLLIDLKLDWKKL